MSAVFSILRLPAVLGLLFALLVSTGCGQATARQSASDHALTVAQVVNEQRADVIAEPQHVEPAVEQPTIAPQPLLFADQLPEPYRPRGPPGLCVLPFFPAPLILPADLKMPGEFGVLVERVVRGQHVVAWAAISPVGWRVGAVQAVGFRYYNPVTGRYISRDPIGYKDGMNVYAYVKNNPINRIDPLGLADKEWHHLVPTEFRDWLKGTYDVDKAENGVLLDRKDHTAKGTGIHSARTDALGETRSWNDDWNKWKKTFDDAGTKPTADQVRAQIDAMVGDKHYAQQMARSMGTTMNYGDYDKASPEGKSKHIGEMARQHKSALKEGAKFFPGRGYVIDAPPSVTARLAEKLGKKALFGLAVVFAVKDYQEGGISRVLAGATGADIPYDLIIKPAGEWANDRMGEGDARRGILSTDVNDEEKRDEFLDRFGGGFRNEE